VTAPSLYVGTFLFSLAGGVVPFLNVEAYLLSVSALSSETAVLPVAAAAALGQMAAKSLLYLAGRGLLKLPLRRASDRIRDVTARLARAQCGAMTLVGASAVTGIPPFYGVSVAAGVLRLRFGRFFAVGCCGRFLRFAAIFILPRLVS
jgi:membrane protein YqaA with SNARE-associated domain